MLTLHSKALPVAVAAVALAAGLTGCGASSPTGQVATANQAAAPGSDNPSAAGAANVKASLRSIANELETYFAAAQSYPETVTQTGAVVTVGANAVPVATGVIFTVTTRGPTVTPGTYCIAASAPGLEPYAYDNDRGGLVEGGCA